MCCTYVAFCRVRVLKGGGGTRGGGGINCILGVPYTSKFVSTLKLAVSTCIGSFSVYPANVGVRCRDFVSTSADGMLGRSSLRV